MNMPDQFLQIAIFSAYDGFVSVLEKLTMATVPSVIRFLAMLEKTALVSSRTASRV